MRNQNKPAKLNILGVCLVQFIKRFPPSLSSKLRLFVISSEFWKLKKAKAMTCCGDNDDRDREQEGNSSNSQEDFDLLPQEYDPKYGSKVKIVF